jgi:hypothetical protein
LLLYVSIYRELLRSRIELSLYLMRLFNVIVKNLIVVAF